MKPALTALATFLTGYVIATNANSGSDATLFRGKWRTDIGQVFQSEEIAARASVNEPSDPLPGTNTGSITMKGSKDEIEQESDYLGYNQILSAVGGLYGPLRITFQSTDGSVSGYLDGRINDRGDYPYKTTFLSG